MVYSHRSVYLHAQVLLTPNAANISMWEKVLLVVPQFHVLGWGFPFVCVMAGADMILPLAIAEARKRCGLVSFLDIAVKRAKLGADAALLGAAQALIHRYPQFGIAQS